MEVLLRVITEDDATLTDEIEQALKEEGLDTRRPRTRGSIEIVVALGSAGAFTALYQVLAKLLERNQGKEVTLERRGTKISLKGLSMHETNELLEQLTPELIARDTPKGKRSPIQDRGKKL